MSAERKPSGRPKLQDGIRKAVTLDLATVEAAEKLGNGNLSLGIRIALSRPLQAPDPASPASPDALPDDSVQPAS